MPPVVNADKSIAVHYLVERQQMPPDTKGRIAPVITLNQPLRHNWKIKDVVLKREGEVVETNTGDPADPSHFEGYFTNLSEGSRHVLIVTLEPIDGEAASTVDIAMEALEDGYGMSFLNLPRPARKKSPK